MLIRVAAGRVVLEAASDFTALSVLLDSRGDLGRGPWEVVGDGSHVLIDPTSLIALAGTAADETWRTAFSSMLEYATSRGWVDSRGRIRVHVEGDSSS